MADADQKIDARDAEPIVIDPPAEPTRSRRWLRPLMMFGIPLIIVGVAGYFWSISGQFVSTDNAYVQLDKVSVSSDVGGRIVQVGVRENQRIDAGDLLFRIDPDPYRIAVDQANAAIAGAQVQVATMQTGIASSGADIQSAQDQLKAARQDYDRQAELMQRGFTTRARVEQAEHQVEQARAEIQRAVAGANEARAKLSTGAAVPGQVPAIASASVQREKAMLDLSRTTVRAPVGGTISQSDRLQTGQMMMSGLPALTIVADGNGWIEANFKETDLNKLRVGQVATLEFDAYPGLELKGHVASIGAGTGSEFSVIPAQNANGNWVKVTQRVPVRIAIDEKSPRAMIAGLSAKVRVDVR